MILENKGPLSGGRVGAWAKTLKKNPGMPQDRNHELKIAKLQKLLLFLINNKVP